MAWSWKSQGDEGYITSLSSFVFILLLLSLIFFFKSWKFSFNDHCYFPVMTMHIFFMRFANTIQVCIPNVKTFLNIWWKFSSEYVIDFASSMLLFFENLYLYYDAIKYFYVLTVTLLTAYTLVMQDYFVNFA